MTIEKSESIVKLAAALAAAQTQIKPAVKDSENPHFRSKYADLSSVWDACREPLTKNGLSVVQMPVDASEAGRVALTTILLHNSGEYISSTVSTRLQKDDAQGVGSALTYLRRYALSAMVGVVADDDDDGNAASKPTEARGAAYSAPAPTNGNGTRNGGTTYNRPTPTRQVPPPTDDTPFCPVHNKAMRVGKNGGYFCATKLDDGSWCKARPEKPQPAVDLSDEWDEIDNAPSVQARRAQPQEDLL